MKKSAGDIYNDYLDAVSRMHEWCTAHGLNFRVQMMKAIDMHTNTVPPKPEDPGPGLSREELLQLIRSEFHRMSASRLPLASPLVNVPVEPTAPRPQAPPETPKKSGRGCFERSPELRERMRQVALNRWKRARDAGHNHLPRASA